MSNNIACVATIGFFDGVHRGHQFLIRKVKLLAAERGIQSVVITFPQHPREVMQPGYHVDLLSTPAEKRAMLRAQGVDHVVELPFTEELSQLSAKDFMVEVLQKRLHVEVLVIGYDHRFGHNRSEGFEDYQHYGQEIGMEVVHAEACVVDGVTVSSSAIRGFLKGGEVTIAARCLGYRYYLQGTVVKGFQNGHKLGFPTANLKVDDPNKLVPADGVYAVWVQLGEQTYGGMLNIGFRPTLDNGKKRSIETYIMHFDQDIYGKPMQLTFVQRIRNEQKFQSLDELKRQLQHDATQVEHMLFPPSPKIPPVEL